MIALHTPSCARPPVARGCGVARAAHRVCVRATLACVAMRLRIAGGPHAAHAPARAPTVSVVEMAVGAVKKKGIALRGRHEVHAETLIATESAIV
jgi:hypothetical protein